MNQFITAILMTFFSTNALADWVFATGDDESEYYEDFSTIVVTGQTVKMWVLENYKFKHYIGHTNVTYESNKFFLEFNCKTKMVHQIGGLTYSKSMGKGKLLAEGFTETPWHSIVPESHYQFIGNDACKYKN